MYLLCIVRIEKKWGLKQRLYPSGQAHDNWPQCSDTLKIAKHSGKTIWFHAASYGEGRGLIALLSEIKLPEHSLLVTITTAWGKEKIQDQFAEQISIQNINLQLAPWFSKSNLENWYKNYQPQALCFFESDTWWPYRKLAMQKKLPIYWISAMFGPWNKGKITKLNQIWFYCESYGMKAIQIQVPEQIELWKKNTTGTIHRGADIKSLMVSKKNANHGNISLKELREQCDSKKYFSMISVHTEEVSIITSFMKKYVHDFPIVFVPRYPKQISEIWNLLKPWNPKEWTRENQNTKSNGESNNLKVLNTGIYISSKWGVVDDVLEQSWGAFIGGTLMPFGGHNIWELLANNVKIYGGPYTWLQLPGVNLVEQNGLWNHLYHFQDWMEIKCESNADSNKLSVLEKYQMYTREKLHELESSMLKGINESCV